MSEYVVFVIVSKDNLKDFSKSILSNIKIPDKINKLIKKEINIKKEILILSSVIFFSELKIFLLIILLGLISLKISIDVVFRRINIRVNFIPEVHEISDPPIKVMNKK
tara:strand:- start:117 stop:440 length:324 start_codon:yes stop_codon:yes gene_type:complete